MSKKIVVGLTGMPGSGKSQVLTILKKIGWLAVSSDEIAHKLLTVPAIQKKIFQKFPECRNMLGDVDRPTLGKIVFRDKARKKILEDILHPPIIQEIKKEINKFRKNYQKKHLAIEIPLLFEKGLEKLFDKVVLVDTPKIVAYKRLKKSRNWSKNYFKQVWKNQISPEVKKRKSDYIIANSTNNMANLRRKLREFQKWIKGLN